jgi:hypothetical protein
MEWSYFRTINSVNNRTNDAARFTEEVTGMQSVTIATIPETNFVVVLDKSLLRGDSLFI